MAARVKFVQTGAEEQESRGGVEPRSSGLQHRSPARPRPGMERCVGLQNRASFPWPRVRSCQWTNSAWTPGFSHPGALFDLGGLPADRKEATGGPEAESCGDVPEPFGDLDLKPKHCGRERLSVIVQAEAAR